MRKASNRDLFNITLTEILIVLFFILMLFSFSQISTFTDEIKFLKIALDTTTKENVELKVEKEDLVTTINATDPGIPAETIWFRMDPDDDIDITTLRPNDAREKALEAVSALKDENTDLKEENEKLEKTIASLTEDGGEPPEPPVIPEWLGDCDGPFTICAPHCLPLEHPVPDSSRSYEYLLDFAFCGTDQYVVQQSAFHIANEYDDEDFRAIPGAEDLVSQELFTRTELRPYLERIFNHGKDRPVDKQCKYAANLIDFSVPKNPWDSARGRGPVQEHFFQNVVLGTDSGKEEYALRFGGNPCIINTAVLNEEESHPTLLNEEQSPPTLLNEEESPPMLAEAPIIKDERPVSRPPHIYPSRALRRNMEGSVELSFTITIIGTVTDVLVLESTSSIFNPAAINAVQRYQYEPKTVNGEPVERLRKRVTLTFSLE